MADRVPFSEVHPGDRITFDGGHYLTGVVADSIGTYSGMRLVGFRADGDDRVRCIAYAAHRSVIVHGG